MILDSEWRKKRINFTLFIYFFFYGTPRFLHVYLYFYRKGLF